MLMKLGLVIYFTFQNSLGEARKPWLGLNQEKGIAGVGTAKKKVVDIEEARSQE
jgi:solute carrier family 35, member F1/2